MLAWRKKPEGFEWHKYIRTTIKVRREARRQRVEDARRAAGQHMNAAGAALVAGSRAAGSAAKDGAIAGAGALALGVQGFWVVLVHTMGVLTRGIIGLVSRPHVGGPLGIIGALAVGAAIGRQRVLGFDAEATLTLAFGLVLMASLLAMLARSYNWQAPSIPGLSAGTVTATALLLALAGGIFWLAGGGSVGSFASMANLRFLGGSPPLQGRAYATGADTLRVGGTNVRLAGIDAPEREQRCGKGGRGWRCGAAAESALSRLVDGRSVTCTISGSDDAGRKVGRCSAGGKDVAGELVRHGHVFADGSLFARYGGEEREARNAKAGMWSGEVERPSEYRSKIWEEAKRRAPEGCPIKGQIAGASRVYVLPWSPDYERVRVQKARGERWFCSEQEAQSAGFKAASGG